MREDLLAWARSPLTAYRSRSLGQGVAAPAFGSSFRIHSPELMSGT